MDYSTVSNLREQLHVATWKTLSDELKQQVIEENMWSYILLTFKGSQGWDFLVPTGGWGQSLIRELRPHMQQGTVKKIIK